MDQLFLSELATQKCCTHCTELLTERARQTDRRTDSLTRKNECDTITLSFEATIRGKSQNDSRQYKPLWGMSYTIKNDRISTFLSILDT